jgi:hypothetical protein
MLAIFRRVHTLKKQTVGPYIIAVLPAGIMLLAYRRRVVCEKCVAVVAVVPWHPTVNISVCVCVCVCVCVLIESRSVLLKQCHVTPEFAQMKVNQGIY